MKNTELVVVFLLWAGCRVTMATLFEYGTGAGDTQLGVLDQFTHPAVTLPYSFTFAGTSYSDLYISDNGAISFLDTASSYLNIADFSISGLWIAPLGFDFHGGANIWYHHYSGSDAQLQQASSLVNQFTGSTGSGSYVAEDLTLVTWEDVLNNPAELNTFQVALTRSTSESNVIFLYGTLQLQGDVVSGISLGDGVNRVLAWDGGGSPAGCAVLSSARELALRSQTSCGTDAGVFVFAVHDTASFGTDPACTYGPQSGCTTETNPNKIARCHARRKRSDRIDL